MHKNLIQSEIKISFNNDFITRFYNVSPAQIKLLRDLAIRMHGKIDKVLLRKLEKLSKENPNLPQIKNYITAAYNMLGNVAKSIEINDQLLKDFPDYLHARLNAANHYIHRGEPDKALIFLGENLDLKESFPTRREFHFTEVQGFYFTTVIYAIEKKDLPLAENRLDFYKAIDEENPRIEELEDRVDDLRRYLRFETDDDFDDNFSRLKEIEPPVTDRIAPPVFHHPEIHQLYQLGFKNAMPAFNFILALPSATVIQDLELVLQDGIERYPFFSDIQWAVLTHSFPLHAMFLLMELKSTESLESILNFLQYQEDFLDLYIGDFLTEEIWQCVYILGKEKPALLKEFLLKPGIYSFTKSAVSNALMQISMLEPHKSKEIEALFEEILNFFINANEEDNVIDPTFLALIIGDVADAKFSTLFPLVEKLYELNYVDLSLEGNFENFIKNYNENVIRSSNYNLKTLSKIYAVSEFYEESEFEKELRESPIHEPKVIQMPINVKINRNDPCPCGIGKKYKKCCIDKL